MRGTLNLICFGLIQITSNLVADGHLHPWSLRAATLVATPAVGLRVYWHFAPCNSWLWKVFAFFSLLAIDDYLLIWSFNHITWLKCTFTCTTCLKRSFISISYLEYHLNHISSRIYFLPGTCSYLRCDLTVASRVTLDECFTFSGVFAFPFQKFSLLLELFTLNFFPSNMTSQLHGRWWPGWQKPARGPGGDIPDTDDNYFFNNFPLLFCQFKVYHSK